MERLRSNAENSLAYGCGWIEQDGAITLGKSQERYIGEIRKQSDIIPRKPFNKMISESRKILLEYWKMMVRVYPASLRTKKWRVIM